MALRRAILDASLETSNFGEAPAAGTLYVPPAHIKALRLEAGLIVGARGVGKSYWTAALGSPEVRKLLGASVPDLDDADVYIGFAEAEDVDRFPNSDTFAKMLRADVDPYDIWRAVVVRWMAIRLRQDMPPTWLDVVAWMKQQPEDAARLMQRSRETFRGEAKRGLIVFDALDRTSSDWRSMDAIVRGLLRAALWLKAFPWLHAKVFLRNDQFERTVTDFPDASKLLSTKEDLTWARHDLHGLLWQRLINAPDPSGEQLRALYMSVVSASPREFGGVYQLAEPLKRESVLQRTLFERLAGPWMGRDRRRGVPYVWAVGHLADGRGQTSPRSFLAAIRQAADDSTQRYEEYPLPLHFESIKRGIQKASQNRVREIAEDYPWVQTFLAKLDGLNVPCDMSQILVRWEQAFPDGPSSASSDNKLPAQHVERGWGGIRDDLIRLGVLELKKDGRIDMPDLYRVGFGLGRRGGVKPKN